MGAGWQDSEQSPRLTQQSCVCQNKALNLNLTLVSLTCALFSLDHQQMVSARPLCPRGPWGQEGVLEGQGLRLGRRIPKMG